MHGEAAAEAAKLAAGGFEIFLVPKKSTVFEQGEFFENNSQRPRIRRAGTSIKLSHQNWISGCLTQFENSIGRHMSKNPKPP